MIPTDSVNTLIDNLYTQVDNDETYRRCISESFHSLEYSSANCPHGKGTPTVVHDPPGTKKIQQSLAKDRKRHSIPNYR